MRSLAIRRVGRDRAGPMRVLGFREAVDLAAARDAAMRRTPTDLTALTEALHVI